MKRIVALGWLGVVAAVAACGGSQGPKGDTGPQGAPGQSSTGTSTASVSGIEPSTGYLQRTAHVTISGYATSWTDSTTVDFGPGVTVSNVHAASPTALVADIAVDKTAALGARDVTVNDKAGKETYAKAFTVAPPATVSIQGSLAQGSIAVVDVLLQDTSTPFDTTSESDLLSGSTTYTNLAVTAPAGVTASINSASSSRVQILLLTDVDAATATADFDLLSGPAGDPTDDEFFVPGALVVASRTATALGATPATGTISKPYDSALYSYTPSGSLAIVDLSASSGGQPAFALLPKSGHFADMIDYYGSQSAPTTTLLPTNTDPYYLVYWDGTGATGAYTMTATSTAPAATHAASTTDNSAATAEVATALPFVLTDGNLTAPTSADWVKVTAAAGDVGKTFHVQTEGDPLTDVAVTLLESDGTTAIDCDGCSPGTPLETGGTVDGTFTIPAAGSYYVVFAAGQLAFSTTDGTYAGIIRVQ